MTDTLVEKFEIAVIELRPGDQVVVRPGRELTQDELRNVSDAARAAWPNNRAIILLPGMSLEIIEPAA